MVVGDRSIERPSNTQIHLHRYAARFFASRWHYSTFVLQKNRRAGSVATTLEDWRIYMKFASVSHLVLALSMVSVSGSLFAQKQPVEKTFDVAKSASEVFDAAVKYFQLKTGVTDSDKNVKERRLDIDPSSSRDLGKLVVTEFLDTGGFRNNHTEYKTTVMLIKDTDVHTTVRVTSEVHQRTKHLKEEPWGKFSAAPEKAAEVAEALKTALATK
jgi:hypothetical protein